MNVNDMSERLRNMNMKVMVRQGKGVTYLVGEVM